jgi:hypothetical protein
VVDENKVARGSRVVSGETMPWNAPGKWMANNWIEASDIAGEDEEHYRRMPNL